MKSRLAPFLALVILGFWCQSASAQAINVNLLYDKKWYLCTQETSDGPAVKNRPAYEKDNYFVFKRDGSYELHDGDNRKNASDPELIKKGTWSWEKKTWFNIDDHQYFLGDYDTKITKDVFVIVDADNGPFIYLTFSTDPVKYGYDDYTSPDDLRVTQAIVLYYNSNCDDGIKALRWLQANKFPVTFKNIDGAKNNNEMYKIIGADGYVEGDLICMPVMIIEGKTYWRERDIARFMNRLIPPSGKAPKPYVQ